MSLLSCSFTRDKASFRILLSLLLRYQNSRVSIHIKLFIYLNFRRLLLQTSLFPKPEDLSCLAQDILRCMQFTEQVIHSFIHSFIQSSIHSFCSANFSLKNITVRSQILGAQIPESFEYQTFTSLLIRWL